MLVPSGHFNWDLTQDPCPGAQPVAKGPASSGHQSQEAMGSERWTTENRDGDKEHVAGQLGARAPGCGQQRMEGRAGPSRSSCAVA